MARKPKEIVENIVEETNNKYLDINEVRKIELAQLEEKVRKLELADMQYKKDKILANQQLLKLQLQLLEKDIQIADLKILAQVQKFDVEREAYRSFILSIKNKYQVKSEKFGFDLETGRLISE